MAQEAPLYDDVADGPKGGRAVWARTSDNIRLRFGYWPADAGRSVKGSLLLMPGRTEYIEKYGRAAKELVARGYHVLVVDWRGQGLSDRLTDDAAMGHVVKFRDYQLDVSAMAEVAAEFALPRPFYLLAHSMGGAIGLRALHDGLDVAAAAFSAPMWGIAMSRQNRPAAWAMSHFAAMIGMGARYVPKSDARSYVLSEPFEDNMLTTDADMFSYMRTQGQAHPDLVLGGPSLRWLNEALRETRSLASLPAPPYPALTLLGTRERIVDSGQILNRMADWPRGTLLQLDGAEHEVLMETPAHRETVFGKLDEFFPAHGN